MIKKLFSLISVAAILVTIAVPMASAEYKTAYSEGSNGKYVYFSDDFDSYVDTSEDGNGLIASYDSTTSKTVVSTTVVDTSAENATIGSRYEFANANANYTISLSDVEKNGSTTKAINIHRVATTSTTKPDWNVRMRKTDIVSGDTCKNYVVLQASIKNGTSSTNAFAGMSVMRNFSIKGTTVGDGGLGTGSTTETASIKQYDWNDYMFVVDKAKAQTTVVLNGEVTDVVGNASTCDAPADVHNGFGMYSDYGNSQIKDVWIDDYTVYEIDPTVYKATCTATQKGNTLVLEYTSPISALTTDDVTVTNEEEATITPSAITFADGKYTISFADGDIEPLGKYNIKVAAKTDIFGATIGEATYVLTGVGKERQEYVNESFDNGTYDSTKITLENGSKGTHLFNWTVEQTEMADGSLGYAAKMTITNPEAENGKTSETSNDGAGRILAAQHIGTNNYYVIKAKMRMGEADGTKAIKSLQVAKATINSTDAASGQWMDVMVTVPLTTLPESGNLEVTTQVSVNGEYKGTSTHLLTASGVNYYRGGILFLHTRGGSEEETLYVDDLEIYTIHMEEPTATVVSAADKSVQFKTEHALTNVSTTDGDTTQYNFDATVNDESVAITDIAVNNGLYSVVLDKELAVGDKVVLTPNGIVDVTGNILTGDITATATAPTTQKVSFNESGNVRFLTVNNTYTSKAATAFIATYDGNKLNKISVKKLDLKPGTSYVAASVDGENARAFLFGTDTLVPLIEE